MGQWLECIREQLKLKPVTGQADTLWEIFWLWMTFTNVRAAKNQSYLLKDSHKVTCIRIRNSDFVIVIIIIIIIMMIGSRERISKKLLYFDHHCHRLQHHQPDYQPWQLVWRDPLVWLTCVRRTARHMRIISMLWWWWWWLWLAWELTDRKHKSVVMIFICLSLPD